MKLEPFTATDVAKLLTEKCREQFWGSIELQIQNGEIITIKTIQTLKKEGNNQLSNDRFNSR